MSINKYLLLSCLGIGVCLSATASSTGEILAGPLFSEFDLTLTPGRRTEAVGPLYYSQESEGQYTWAIPPLTLAHTEDPSIGYEEFDFAYPLFTYDRFGTEYRWQLFQFFSFAGGINQNEDQARRFTLFPIYFQQRSADPSLNYTAVFPFYGTLKNRIFRDEIEFAMFPLYSKTRRRDIVTYNAPYPFFHIRRGNGLAGWQFWPLYGREHKDITSVTNGFNEVHAVPGHDRTFVLWPFFTDAINGLEPVNAAGPAPKRPFFSPWWPRPNYDHYEHQQAFIPFYSLTRSEARYSTTAPWPFGVTHTVDHEKKFTEWGAPWPLIVFDRGEGKYTDRVWPFLSRSHNQYLESDWYMWPVYKFNRVNAPPLDRQRTRILFYLYSDVKEKNTETGQSFRRVDLLPFFTHRRDFNGNERLQVLSILEPFFPNNKSIERDYSQLYSFWRAEHNPKTGAASQSLLWNLYRHESAPQTKKFSLLFGLFQYQSSPEGRRCRVCYIPLGRTKSPPPGTSSKR